MLRPEWGKPLLTTATAVTGNVRARSGVPLLQRSERMVNMLIIALKAVVAVVNAVIAVLELIRQFVD